ncbi:hypothetical protein HDV05_007256 [Chytridiales sp. JEL 0842]|nr:hypothetical protein HDV05_007256 [Chytridiales sp. JEL 0842]
MLKPSHRIPLASLGIFVYCTSTYASYHIYKLHSLPRPPPTISDPTHQESHTGVYTTLAPDYDSKIAWDEFWLGFNRRRQHLLSQAKGHVVELASGTGRNLPYYPTKNNNNNIASLTLTDSNPHMLQRAYEKYKSLSSSSSSSGSGGFPPVILKLVDATRMKEMEAGKYDTVVDTFGLCSFPDPVEALKEMSRIAKEDKEGGRILLLEHGRSYYDWLNEALDKTASSHAKAWGCWWNRDIEKLVRDAGLEVLEMKRFHFGTTYEIVARRGRGG